MQTITTTALKKQLEKDDNTVVLINVLPEEYCKTATLPGAKNFCVYKTSFIDDVKKEIKDMDTTLVVFGLDSKHEAAERAGELLTDAGYTKVLVYKQGITGWEKSGGKIVGTKKMPAITVSKKNFTVDTKESFVTWEGSNIGNRHYGTITIARGKIETDKKKITGGTIVLDMDSITNEDITDKKMSGYLIDHLKSSDFFEVAKYPTATIKIQKATKISEQPSNLNYKVDALVTIKGITKKVAFPIHGHVQDKKLVAQGSLVLDRSLFGVKYGSSRFFEWLGTHLVHDQIRLRFKVVAG